MASSSSSAAPLFGIKDEEQQQQHHHHHHHLQINPQLLHPTAAPTSSQAPPPPSGQKKKKRNLPGTPYPDAEVIALSPKSLLATNRFVCEVCSKGFQREQNLQLHRRGHNLPWKLRQKNPADVVRRRVYLCPEPTCVHHDPSRALGDLTGVKKHYCRKHGEKKWKCDKCSKRYAVQSDWKAHSKTCGTREYRCDCGTIFSRRDSFITHRAFCDALAQENNRLPTSLSTLRSNLYGNISSSTSLGLSQLSSQFTTSLQEQAAAAAAASHHPSADLLRLDSAFRQPPPPVPSSAFFLGVNSQNDHYSGEQQTHHSFLQNKPLFHGLMQLPDLQSDNSTPSSSNMFNLGFFPNSSSASNSNAMATNHNNHLLMHPNLVTDQSGGYSIYNNSMQNDQSMLPQMSATALLQKAVEMGATASGNGRSSLLRGYVNSSPGGEQAQMESEANMQNLMLSSLTNGNSNIFGGFDPGFCNMEGIKFPVAAATFKGSEGLTRDFLGVGREQQMSHGLEMSSMDPEMKSAQMSASFGGGRLL